MTYDPYRWRRRLAGVSGAALGYIGGNVGGAVAGYKLGRRLEKLSRNFKMPKRKYSGTDPSRKYARRAKQIYGSKFGVYGSAGTPKPKRRVSFESRGNDQGRTGSKRVSKGINKRKKRVKVSNALREKVKKVLDDEDQEWSGTHVMYVPPLLAGQTVANKREFFNFPHLVDSNGTTTSIFRQGELFTPNSVLDSASKCFNLKPVPTSTTSNSTADIFNFFDATNFNGRNISVKATYQAAKFWIRNNTSRTYRVCMYVLTVKQGCTTNDDDCNFISAFLRETTAYNTANFLQLQEGFSGTGTFNNGYVTTQYKNEPRMYANIRKRWDVKTIDMVLEPGQVETQYVKGPVMEYDMKKYVDNSTYYTCQKGNMFTAFSIMADPIQHGDASQNKLEYTEEIQASGALKGQLLFECERLTKVKMPEMTGMDADTEEENNLRRKDAYVYEEYFPTFTGDPNLYRRKDAELTVTTVT